MPPNHCPGSSSPGAWLGFLASFSCLNLLCTLDPTALVKVAWEKDSHLLAFGTSLGSQDECFPGSFLLTCTTFWVPPLALCILVALLGPRLGHCFFVNALPDDLMALYRSPLLQNLHLLLKSRPYRLEAYDNLAGKSNKVCTTLGTSPPPPPRPSTHLLRYQQMEIRPKTLDHTLLQDFQDLTNPGHTPPLHFFTAAPSLPLHPHQYCP